jgi:hypothetical protein
VDGGGTLKTDEVEATGDDAGALPPRRSVSPT